jgi:hypothetical protein
VATADDGDDVADDGSGGGGDDADATREGGQGALAGGIEEAFGEEAGLELLEGKLERAGTTWLHVVGDELELTARLVDGDATADEDGEAIGGTEAEEGGFAAEENDGELCAGVLEGEVDVTGRRGAAVGDFPFDPEVGVGAFDLLADAVDESGYGPDTARRLFRGGWRRRRSEEQVRLLGATRLGAASTEAGQRGRVLLPWRHMRLSLAG